MKKNIRTISTIVTLCCIILSQSLFAGSDFKVPTLLINVILRNHYTAGNNSLINDSISKLALPRYIESLDSRKMFFTENDIAIFKHFENILDDRFRSYDTSLAFEVYRLLKLRATTQLSYAYSIVDTIFDFSKSEEMIIDLDQLSWAKSSYELNERWYENVKYDFLILKLEGKIDLEIRTVLKKRYKKQLSVIMKKENVDIYYLYVNAFLFSIDPHTMYFTPRGEEVFNIQMSLSVEGIGAVLEEENDKIKITRVVKGGPVFKDGRILADDLIVGIGEGARGEIIDIVGVDLKYVADMIRGPIGSTIRLEMESAIGDSKGIIELIRDKIELEDLKAKGSIIKGIRGLGNKKIGLITIPSFYEDFNIGTDENKGASIYSDVKNIVLDLKQREVDGIVINLMNNGGGSLSEVNKMAGIFIGENIPSVYVKDQEGVIVDIVSEKSDVTYDGPLVVLINHNSISSSEIFAGYIKDYRRGIIVGEGSFGKGTVQTIVDLDLNKDLFNLPDDEKYGSVHLTIQKFFRVNGQSTQNRGVLPHIYFPTSKYILDKTESSIASALEFEAIDYNLNSIRNGDRVNYTPVNIDTVKKVNEMASARIMKSELFSTIVEELKYQENLERAKSVSLNFKTLKVKQQHVGEFFLKTINQLRQLSGLSLLSNLDDLMNYYKGEEYYNVISRVYSDEGARILVDYMNLSIN